MNSLVSETSQAITRHKSSQNEKWSHEMALGNKLGLEDNKKEI